MITIQDITAESATALSDDQMLALKLLVAQYENYKRNIGIYPNFDSVLNAEKTTPTVKTKALKAVLTRLSQLPKLVVESSGSDKARSFFSTKQNWDALAKDVLNTLYNQPMVSGTTQFMVGVPPLQLNIRPTARANAPFIIL